MPEQNLGQKSGQNLQKMSSNINCHGIDEMLCDYLDNTLTSTERLNFESHTAACAACAQMVADCGASLKFLERVALVEPPKELVTRILHNTPKESPFFAAILSGGPLRRWLKPMLQPLLQPRLVMGMAMTILSFSMLGKFVSPVRQLKPADLDPVKVWRTVDDSAHRTWDRFVKYYDNLRLVYEVQTTLDEWKNSNDPADSAAGLSGADVKPTTDADQSGLNKKTGQETKSGAAK